jgi:acyl-[acyl-carrier-protein]-phospholipid O-acyltransferase/long-chain-fatty-acid--[acyl-carrier-protein] ligase
MTYRLEPIEGIEEGGRLHVAGPNVMKGYLLADRPGHLQPPADGWYDTGDIVAFDAQGFMRILGRAKRFAKIGGEMVSLAAVESMIREFWPEEEHAVVAMPHDRKGEELVLVTTRNDADRLDLQQHLKASGRSELMLPARILVVGELPLLGTGKVDYPAIQRQVRERMIEA